MVRALSPLAVAHQLDGNRTLEPGVHGAVDLAHAPAADQLIEAIVIDGNWQHRSAARIRDVQYLPSAGSGHYNRSA